MKESEFPGIAVSFADVAGERYLLEKSDSQLWNHLAGCHGLICLIDPEDCVDQFQATNRLGALLKQKIKNEKPDALIKGKRYLPHYLSLCFSKMDRPEWKRFSENQSPDPNELISYLEDESGFNIRKILETDFSPDRITFYYISSVGLNSSSDNGGTAKNKKIKPYNIFEPLNEWIK